MKKRKYYDYENKTDSIFKKKFFSFLEYCGNDCSADYVRESRFASFFRKLDYFRVICLWLIFKYSIIVVAIEILLIGLFFMVMALTDK